MIVGGNEVYLLSLPWDTVSLLGDQCPLSSEEEGQAGSQAAGWRKPSTSARVTLSPKRSQQAPAETGRDAPPDAGAMSFHTETWATVPQRLKRTSVMDIASSGS